MTGVRPFSGLTAVVTGANKGLGLEFASQLLRGGWNVHAACRQPDAATALSAMAEKSEGRLTVEALDVTDPVSVAAMASRLAGHPLDLLVNNAGIIDAKPASFTEHSRKTLQALGSIDYAGWLDVFKTNVLGSLRVTEALLANLEASEHGMVAMISTVMGSITANSPEAFPPGGGIYLYRSSKAALNMVARSLAADLRERGITVLALNPGWVKTDMGGPDARFDAETSVGGMINVLANKGLAETGSFFSHDGAQLPW